jgi:alkylation response protein AidB-like acyl-CoA dehydrogenase
VSSTESPHDPIAAAQKLADDVLFPSALATDLLLEPPRSILDEFARIGLYGLSIPRSFGGIGADATTTLATVEALAGGCLSTTFVWLQHLSPARAIAMTEHATRWSSAMAAGSVRCGVAFAHLRRPGPPMLRARRDGEGWRVNGDAPWVSGWGAINVVHVAAIDDDMPENIVWTLLDARQTTTLTVTRPTLAAMNATATVVLRARDHQVPADRVTVIEQREAWLSRDALGLRANGSLALGVTLRCVDLLGDGGRAFRGRVADVRGALDVATGPETLADARAAASLLAVDAAMALVASGGGGAIRSDAHAQRLAREAMFLLVQGQTPSIRAHQIRRLALR